MKRLALIILCLIVVGGASGCSSLKKNNPGTNEKQAETTDIDSVSEAEDAPEERQIGIERKALAENSLHEYNEENDFLLAVEDVFTITDRGTIITGKIIRGTINVGDMVEIIGLHETRTAEVIEIEMARKAYQTAVADQDIAIILKDIKRTDIQRGQVLAKSGSIQPHTGFKAVVTVLSEKELDTQEPFEIFHRPPFYFRTTDVTGKIIGSEDEITITLIPGEKLEIEVSLVSPIAMEEGTNFAIMERGLMVAEGTVTKIIK